MFVSIYHKNKSIIMDSNTAVAIASLKSYVEEHVAKVSDILIENSVPGGQQIRDCIKATPKTIDDRLKEELEEKFLQYSTPLCTFEDHVKIYNDYKREGARRQREKEIDRNYSTYRAESSRESARIINVTPHGGGAGHGPYSFLREGEAELNRPELDVDYDDHNLHKSTDRVGDRLLGYNPHTQHPYSLPLQFQQTVTLKYFAQEIEFFPGTNVLKLDSTLKKFLKRGEFIGLSRDQLSTALKLLIKEYMNDYHITINALDDNKEVFDEILCLIGTAEVLTNVRELLDNFTRDRGLPIKACFSRYRTLFETKLSAENPGLSVDSVKRKALRMSSQHLQYMVSPACQQFYTDWFKRARRNGESIDLKACLKQIEQLELDGDACRPQTDILVKPNQNQDEGVSLFFTQLEDKQPVEEVEILLSDYNLRQTEARKNNAQNSDQSRGRSRQRGRGRGGAQASRGHQPRGRGGGGGRGRDRQDQPQFSGQSRPRSQSRPRRSGNDNQRQRSQSVPFHGFPSSRSQTPGPSGGRGFRGAPRGRGSWRPRGRGTSSRPYSRDRSTGRSGPSGSFNKSCWKCLDPGHLSSQCHYRELMTRDCAACGRGRHDTRWCRSSRGRGQGGTSQGRGSYTPRGPRGQGFRRQ